MAKDVKLKVPKRIAGTKVPKKLRKTANRALAFAEHPAARELAIAALTAAASALAKGRGGAASGEAVAQAARAEASKLSDMVIAAALDGARRLVDGLEGSAPAAGPEEEPKGRRASGGRAARPATPDG